MKAFELFAARDLQHAVALLAEHAPSVKVLAGGTDLLVDLKASAHSPAVVVDISRVEELKGIGLTDQGLRIGALVTHTEITRSPLIWDVLPVLAEAAQTVGAVQTRNLGTIGGNLVTSVPSMDSGPALIALESLVTVAGPGGNRQVTLDEFFVGPRKNVLRSDELLAEILIPKKNLRKPSSFLKFGLRKGQALALVNVAASCWVNWKANVFVEPRIGLGAVAPTVIHGRSAETYLEGRAITPDTMIEAGRIAAGEAEPISDFRASADYRRELIAVLTKRALGNVYARARETRAGDFR